MAEPTPFVPREKRFTPAMLGRLQEVGTLVQCECPNQLASLVTSLQAFEDYSKACESRNEADAAMHRLLYEETAKARVLLEEALAQLCAFEKIEL